MSPQEPPRSKEPPGDAPAAWPVDVSPGRVLRIGTRGSTLALWQARWVTELLRSYSIPSELVIIRTRGDVDSAPLRQMGGNGVFAAEIRRALADGRIDIAVHSLKDLPSADEEGLAIVATPKRERTEDALVVRDDRPLIQLPQGATLGTGSPRRRSQLLRLRPDLHVEDVRGNVDTRLSLVREGRLDGILLAHAGLTRLGLDDQISEVLSPQQMLPAAGQGAVAVEMRSDDCDRAAIARLNHPPTWMAVSAERALLATLHAGCLAPIGVLAVPSSPHHLRLTARLLSLDGRDILEDSLEGEVETPRALGQRLAEQLLSQGADRFLDRT